MFCSSYILECKDVHGNVLKTERCDTFAMAYWFINSYRGDDKYFSFEISYPKEEYEARLKDESSCGV